MTSVKELMTVNPITIHPKDKIESALEFMRKHKIHHLPITVANKVVGIVSMGDLLFFQNCRNNNSDMHLKGTEFSLTTIDEIMHRNVVCVEEEESIKKVIELMNKNSINSLPVLDSEKNLVGIVTTHDLVEFLLKFLQL